MAETWSELFTRAAKFEIEESQIRAALREHRTSSDRGEDE